MMATRPTSRRRPYRQRVASLTPEDPRAFGTIRRRARGFRSALVLATIDLNNALVGWAVRRRSGWWDTAELPWNERLEAAFPAIRAELDHYLDHHLVPTTAELNGLSASESGDSSCPSGNAGWRVLLLRSFGRTVEANAVHFPETMDALSQVPAIANVGFSCMEGRSHIHEHCDPNRGALRYQLPIVIPGPPGSCRIRVGPEEVEWAEGRAVVFDLGTSHETCNESDDMRVLLMFEVLMPLAWPLSVVNRLAQRAYRHFPGYADLPDRATSLTIRERPGVEPTSPRPTYQLVPGDRPTLADPDAQAALERYGFAVVRALDDELLAQVRDAHDRLGPAPDDPKLALNWSFHSRDSAHKQAVKRELRALVGPVLERMFVDHEAYLTTFITKWPGANSAFAPHQDPSLVDERRFRGTTLWIALTDTPGSDGRDNGMLHMVPGSHLFSSALRVSDVDRFPFAAHEEAILTRFGQGVALRAGDALVFDNRVIHYSLPNATEEPRVILSFGMRPREASCVLLRTRDDGAIDIHHIPDDFYIDVLPAEHHLYVPADPPIATVDPITEEWTSEEFAALCEAVGVAPGAARYELAAAVTSVDPTAFCAACGRSDGLHGEDRVGRNNAQLICPDCREQLAAGRR